MAQGSGSGFGAWQHGRSVSEGPLDRESPPPFRPSVFWIGDLECSPIVLLIK